jgi:UDP-GlcNAc:undecaprenyl-phosphate GlcNAc-1-phosphate transferase
LEAGYRRPVRQYAPVGDLASPMMYALFAITLAICWFAEPVANWLQVYDYPRGGRKNHGTPTPQVGGLAILLPVGVWLAARLAISHTVDPLDQALFLCGAGVGTIGIMDDQSHLPAGGRIVALAVFSLIAFSLDPGLIVRSVPSTEFGQIQVPAPVFVAFAVVAITGFVSSVNMADGINGLVTTAFLIWCAGFAVFTSGEIRLIALALTGPLLVVLVFNVRGRLFLGDCGTFGIGFVVALLGIAALRQGSLSAETLLVWFFVPVLDCLRVIASRLRRGRSPLRGGKDHFHHLLADIFGKRRALYVYGFTMLTTSALAALVPMTAIFLLIALTALGLGFVAAKEILSERERLQPVPKGGARLRESKIAGRE